MWKTKEGQDILGAFQIRSEESLSQPEIEKCYSTKSEQQNSPQISETIQNMIEEEKKKYKISKTQNKIQKSASIMKMKKFYSVSTIYALKPTFILPLHISRIFNSNKRYPNVPFLQKNQRTLDTIYGAFFGFLIGDVTGAYLAYTNQRLDLFLPSALLMNGGGTYNLGAGQGTDQTEILFTVCYGLIQGKGEYNQNIMAKKYLQWIESKPFNFSTIIALSLRQLRKLKESEKLEEKKMGKVLRQQSLKNMKFQSSLGLIRILPLVVFSLKFNEIEFEKIIKQELSLICPNYLVFQTGFVYARALRIIIQTNDHEKAFYEVSKWVYEEGSPKLKELWKMVEYGIEIQSRGNMGKLKTSFTYACIQLSKKQINFFEILTHNLQRGGDTDANCAIVMTLVGAIVGYNGIPGYFKQKIINSRMKDSPRPRDQIYATHKVVNLIEALMRGQPNRLFNIS